MASGEWNGWPSLSIADTPLLGITTVVGDFALLSFFAMISPSFAFSSIVVRINVTVGLCW